MDDSYQKAILSLVSVFVGWLLGQGTYFIQKSLFERRIKKALLTELEGIKNRLLLIKKDYERHLATFSKKSIAEEIAVKIPNHIYAKYFPEISIKLNDAQRHSFQLLHGYLEGINNKIDMESDLIRDYFVSQDIKKLNLWGASIHGQYRTICSLIWHINYHLANKNNPDLITPDKYADTDYSLAMKKCRQTVEHILKNIKINS